MQETPPRGHSSPGCASARLTVSLATVTRTQREDEPRRLLQWIQRHAGVSRRKAQDLIASGEVSLNGKRVTDPFLPVSQAGIQKLALRGHPLPIESPESRIYRYHKPRDVLCSHDDRFYGNTVGRVLRAEGFVGYTWAGRLDRDAEGLLLLSNDGDLIHAFTHPRYEVPKTYHVWLERLPKADAMGRIFSEMRKGIADEGDTLRILEGRVEGRPARATIVLAEGRKHEVKRLFAHFGLDVTRLVRSSIGPVKLENLRPGEISRLSSAQEQAVFAFARSRLDGE